MMIILIVCHENYECFFHAFHGTLLITPPGVHLLVIVTKCDFTKSVKASFITHHEELHCLKALQRIKLKM